MPYPVVEKGVRKTADFLYDGTSYDLLAQYLSHGNPRTTYYFRDGNQMLSRYEYSDTEPGQWYADSHDGLGSVSAWSNQTGVAVQEYKYSAYGRLIDNNGPDNTSSKTDPLYSVTFSGKVWDRELETYYFGARDYEPGSGVWLTQDKYRGELTQPASLHRTIYANDNPVTLVDRYGYSTTPWSTAMLSEDKVAGQSAQLRSSQSNAAAAKSQVLGSTAGGALTKCTNGGAQQRRYLPGVATDIIEMELARQKQVFDILTLVGILMPDVYYVGFTSMYLQAIPLGVGVSEQVRLILDKGGIEKIKYGSTTWDTSSYGNVIWGYQMKRLGFTLLESLIIADLIQRVTHGEPDPEDDQAQIRAGYAYEGTRPK